MTNKKVYVVKRQYGGIIGIYSKKKDAWNKAVNCLKDYQIHKKKRAENFFYENGFSVLTGIGGVANCYLTIEIDNFILK